MHRERFPVAKNPNPNGGMAASKSAMDRTPGVRMNRPVRTAPAFAATPLLRRFVLGTAFFLGLAVALAPRLPAVHAQEPKSPPAAAPAPPAAPSPPKAAPKSLSITDGHGAEIKIDVGDAATRAGDATEDSPKSGKAKKRARVTIDGIDTDREFDSFDDFVHNEPALAAMVISVVTVVFLAPVLAIALILWYRMRKARMLNETMLKLAEKGVVPSTEALDALAGGKQPAAVAPYLEQAKQIRRRAAWSDLRKGVLMAGFGIALSMYSLLSDREPNGLGLVLLFVGLGFIVLWWFEQRHLVPADGTAQDATRVPGAGIPPGSPPPA
jgi:hypothetical protein